MAKKHDKEPTERARTGRPTKLTPETQARIVDAIRDGMTYETACALSSITYSTFRNWIIAGENTGDGIYYEFLQSVKKANAEAEAELVQRIKSAGQREWQANAWILERRYPDRWGRRDRTEAVTTNFNIDLETLTDEQLARLANGESITAVLGAQG